jgi:predicted permease
MNLAVLLIARATARAREIALRVALGASGARIRRQLIAEAMPLCLAGLGGGLFLAWTLLRALVPYLPAGTPRVSAIGLQTPVLAFSAAISLAVVLLATLLPARSAARSHPGAALQQTSRITGGGARARNLLVLAQIAITLVLLFGGLLFARSFSNLLQVNPGFSSRGVLTMHLAVTRAKYREDERVADYYRRILDRVQSIPGVTAAGVVNRLPFSGIAQTGGVEFEGRSGGYDSDWRSASPGYFEAIGVPLKRGRLFTDADRPQSPPAGLIDERMARQVFGGENPIGKRFRRYLPGFSKQDPWCEIVGVVGHILNDSLERDPRPQVYWPETQRTQDRAALVVRTLGAPEPLAPAVIQQIRQENPDQPVYDIRSMEQWVGRTLETRILVTGMVGLFGAASLLLACIGLYGVVSYTADLRMREFGIRMALGADASRMRALVLWHAGKLALAGSASGLALAWPAGRALQTFLFSVTNSDAVSWLAAPALLIAVALLSGCRPAWKAAKSDPALILRE